jgi:hypothetical protein
VGGRTVAANLLCLDRSPLSARDPGAELSQEIRRDPPAILLGRAHVVDRCDLAPVCDSRSGIGATLPIARRGLAGVRSSHTPATTIFAIACAARVPTFRNH